MMTPAPTLSPVFIFMVFLRPELMGRCKKRSAQPLGSIPHPSPARTLVLSIMAASSSEVLRFCSAVVVNPKTSAGLKFALDFHLYGLLS
jgi:hypothetical protein